MRASVYWFIQHLFDILFFFSPAQDFEANPKSFWSRKRDGYLFIYFVLSGIVPRATTSDSEPVFLPFGIAPALLFFTSPLGRKSLLFEDKWMERSNMRKWHRALRCDSGQIIFTVMSQCTHRVCRFHLEFLSFFLFFSILKHFLGVWFEDVTKWEALFWQMICHKKV